MYKKPFTLIAIFSSPLANILDICVWLRAFFFRSLFALHGPLSFSVEAKRETSACFLRMLAGCVDVHWVPVVLVRKRQGRVGGRRGEPGAQGRGWKQHLPRKGTRQPAHGGLAGERGRAGTWN